MLGDSSRHLFGFAIAVVADRDGDGRRDWVIGSPSGSTDERHGRVELWSSRGVRLEQVVGDEPSFGVGVAGLGDVDGDGFDDFAAAAAPLLQNAAAQGAVSVISGRKLAPLRVLRNDVAGVWFGAAIAAVGDADGDGCSDLAVGGNYGDAPGLVRLYSSRTGAVLQTFRDASPHSGFGSFVGEAGDCDGDGAGDIVVAAVRDAAAPADEAGVDQVFVYSGRSGERLATFTGSTPGARFGGCVRRYAGEGRHTTFAVGVAQGGVLRSGAVEFWSAAAGLQSSMVGPGVGSNFGQMLAALPDQDGDGFRELFVTLPAPGSGQVWRVQSTALQLGAMRR
jgi:hypothetical protein